MSKDRGATWKEVFADGLDNTHSYTGFVSLLPRRAVPARSTFRRLARSRTTRPTTA